MERDFEERLGERHLSLIKTDHEEVEKRVFPRFPFGLLVFKDAKGDKVYEVKDISLTGMQLALKDGDHPYKKGDEISGRIQWKNSACDLKGTIAWSQDQNVGVHFKSSISFESKLRDFLSYENITAHIRAVHKTDLDLVMPNDLKYWFKADGVLEIFIWELKTVGISRFQVLFLDHFIEWSEGVGIKTGKLLTQRDLETPLGLEDEFHFQMDTPFSGAKAELALGAIKSIPSEHLPKSVYEFLIYKLGG